MATQIERREATITRLVDATIAVLHELGYAAASTQVICDRAGVSQGALFRHFKTRRALMAHAAEVVALRQIETFRSRVPADRVVATEADARELIADAVALGDSPENHTWHELMTAARTDAALRAELQDATDTYQREILMAAAQVLGQRIAGEIFVPTMRIIFSFVDGLALAAPLTHDQAGIDAAVDTFAQILWAGTQGENA